MTSSPRIRVRASDPDGSAVGAAVPGGLVQPWLVLLKPPFDELADRAAVLGHNGDLRAVVEIDDGTLRETINGAVFFNDPLDHGMLAAVLLDRPSRAGVQRLPVAADHRPTASLATVYDYLVAIGTGAAKPSAPTAGARSDLVPAATEPEAVVPELRLGWPPVDLPHGPPPLWPPGLDWPPVGDDRSLRLLCWMMPCLRCCPANNRCTVPDPGPGPVGPVQQ